MGVDYIDYIVADRHVIPQGYDAFYSEGGAAAGRSISRTTASGEISAQVPPRTELKLPEHGFVFCCFNSSYKFTPAVFDIWMRLLKKVDGSVLWLLDESEPTPNLQARSGGSWRGCDAPGVCPALSLADHLARESRADLFSIPSRAMPTRRRAMRYGPACRLVTCMGETFASRGWRRACCTRSGCRADH